MEIRSRPVKKVGISLVKREGDAVTQNLEASKRKISLQVDHCETSVFKA